LADKSVKAADKVTEVADKSKKWQIRPVEVELK